MPNPPTVFISYRRELSVDLAQSIHARLKAAGVDVFIDLDAIDVGEDYELRLERELDQRDCLLVILAPETLTRSTWVPREIASALRRSKKIIPVTTGGYTFSRQSLPPEIADLSRYNYVPYEPLYADAAFDKIKRSLGLTDSNTPQPTPVVGTAFLPSAASPLPFSPVPPAARASQQPPPQPETTQPRRNRGTCGLVLVVGLIALVLALFILNQTGILSSLIQSPAATTFAAGTTMPIPQGWIAYQNQRTEPVFLEKQDIPLENCNGNNPITSNVKRDRATTTTIALDTTVNLEAGLSAIVKASVSAQFNVTEGETRSASQEISVAVNPGSQVNYELTWYETWQVGEIVIANLDNLTVPYRVRTGLQAEVRSGSPQLCPALSTASAVVLAATPVPPTITLLPPTPMPLPPSATLTPSTTPVPPANTPVPPTPASTSGLVIGEQAVIAPNSDGYLNLRSAVGRDNPVLAQVTVGSVVLVLDGPTYAENGLWWKLRAPSGVIGWTVEVVGNRQTLLPFVTSATPLSPTPTIVSTQTTLVSGYPCDAHIVSRVPNSIMLNVVRSYPSGNAPLKDAIQQSEIIIILEKSETSSSMTWYRIGNLTGKELGWISKEFVSPSVSCPL